MAARSGLIRAGASASVVLAVVLGLAAPARAQTVVVFPFDAGDDDLAIYRRPVADAVAKVLRDGYHVSAQVAGGEQPRAEWVVELRVARERKLVRLEAWLREADAGDRRPAVSVERSALAGLDKAAVNLAHRVGLRLQAAIDARKARAHRSAPPPPAPVAPRAPAPAPAAPAPDPRPAVIVYRASGENVGEARAVAAAGASELLAELGYRAVPQERIGLFPVELAAGDATVGGARAALMIDVSHLDFAWDGVLTAHGTVRLVAISPQSQILFNRDLVTDTVVGARSDGHAALVRYVIRQAMDIARRELAVALGRP
jgi:hypothetical protein